MRRWILFAVCSTFLGVTGLLPVPQDASAQGRPALPAFAGAKEGAVCIGCHSRMNNAMVYEWRASRMGQKGVNCFDCHRAEKGDPDAFEHNGFLISVIVSPKDCGRCHQKQVDEQKGSHHAKGGQILASIDNYLERSWAGPRPWPSDACSATGRRSRSCPAGSSIPPPGRTAESAGSIPTEAGAAAPRATRVTDSRWSKPAAQTPAASATSGRTTPRWKCTRSPSTASCTRRSGTS